MSHEYTVRYFFTDPSHMLKLNGQLYTNLWSHEEQICSGKGSISFLNVDKDVEFIEYVFSR